MIVENQIDKDHRERAARGAKRTGYIRIIDLMDIMAEDENYADILATLRKEFLPKCWIGPCEYVGKDSAGEDDEKWVEPDDLLNTPGGRIYYWLNLIRRWAGLEADPTKERLPDIPYLKCYSHDRKTDTYIIIDREVETPDHIKHFVNLDKFEKYIKDVEYVYQIQIPLPELLFPETDEIEEHEPERFIKGSDELSDRDPVERIDTDQLPNNSFILNCDVWEVRFRGENTNIKDLERIRYIIHLLDNPGVEFTSHRLVSLVKGTEPLSDKYYSGLSEEQLQKEGLCLINTEDNNISNGEFEDFKKTGYDLLGEIIEAKENDDNDKLARNEEKWNAYFKYGTDDLGIFTKRDDKYLRFYKKSRLSPEAEKTRTLARNHIKNTLKDINQKFSSLGRHLENSINTGAKCFYKPEEPTEWFIRW